LCTSACTHTNPNVIQDPGAPPIAVFSLTLTRPTPSGPPFPYPTPFRSNGKYLFTEAPGTYTVTVDASNFTSGGALAAFFVSPTLQGADPTVVSNTNPTSTSPATPTEGSSDLTNDFGYYQDVPIGGVVCN